MKEFNQEKSGVLSDVDIFRGISDGTLNIESVEKLHVGPSSVDLTLFGTAKRISERTEVIDSSVKDCVKYDEVGFDSITINPGDFYILSTNEKITIGKNIAAFVCGRSSLARIGLNVHMAGFVDPGFSGTITLEVANFTRRPIVLYKGMRICQFVFMKTTSECALGYGEKKGSKYQGQMEPGTSKIYQDFENK